MPRLLPAFAAVICCSAPAAAQMSLDSECVLSPDSQDSCSHVIACIGGETLFVGGGYGWDAGELHGTLSTGAECTGEWNNDDGLATFSCSDGVSGEVVYWSLDGETGTSLGSGATEDGRPIEAWSGTEIAAYIQRETGEVTLQCGPESVPLS